MIAARIPRADRAGASLGALVAPEVAIRHPGSPGPWCRVTGRPRDGRSGKAVRRMLPELLRPPAADPVEGLVRLFTRIGSRARRSRHNVRTT